MIRLRRVLAGTLTVVWASIVATGCSGERSLTAVEYRTEVGQECRDLRRRTSELSQPTSTATEQFVRVGRRALALQRAALGRIQSLDAPSTRERAVGRWLDLVDGALDASAASLAAQSEGDLAAARAANERGRLATERADARARSLGIDDCVTAVPG